MQHLIFDTETTDLVKNSLRVLDKQPRIIEFFGLKIDDDFNEVGVFHQVINPGLPIAEAITKITGIDNETVKDKPRFEEIARPLAEFILSADVVVAHNLSYDISVVDFEFWRMKQLMQWPRRRVCTVEATEHMKGYRLSLTNLHQELFGEGFHGAHRAEYDVRALAKCYVELMKRGEV